MTVSRLRDIPGIGVGKVGDATQFVRRARVACGRGRGDDIGELPHHLPGAAGRHQLRDVSPASESGRREMRVPSGTRREQRGDCDLGLRGGREHGWEHRDGG